MEGLCQTTLTFQHLSGHDGLLDPALDLYKRLRISYTANVFWKPKWVTHIKGFKQMVNNNMRHYYGDEIGINNI